MNERDRVSAYLQQIKDTIANPVTEVGWVLVLRPENKECILQLGFKKQDIKDTILGLSVEDYCEGPCKDHDIPGELWIFGKVIDGKLIYIKIKLASFGTLRMVRVISFHFALHALTFPLKSLE